MNEKTREVIDLREFTPETISALNEATLRQAHPWVAYTLGFIYQNKSSTADLEGCMDVADRLSSGSPDIWEKGNRSLFCNFMRRASDHAPATCALFAANHLSTMMQLLPEEWLESMAKGFMKNGVTVDYQVDAIGSLLKNVLKLQSIESDQRMFRFESTENRDNLLIMLVLAHSAVMQGVLPRENSPEETLRLLTEAFCKLNQPNGFETLNRLSHKFLTHETFHYGARELTASERLRRLDDVVNPLFMLYVNNAHRAQLFGTKSKEILSGLTTLLRSTGYDKPRDVHLFNQEMSRQLVLRTLMASPETWRDQLKRTPKGPSAMVAVIKLHDRLGTLMAEIDSLRYDDEEPLKKMVFKRLFETIIPWVAKQKDCGTKYSNNLIELLAPHVDFAEQYASSRGLTKNLLTTYITESRRDLIGLINRKDRGKLLEDELGM